MRDHACRGEEHFTSMMDHKMLSSSLSAGGLCSRELPDCGEVGRMEVVVVSRPDTEPGGRHSNRL